MTIAGTDLSTSLYTTILPIALAVIMGIIGIFRGATREAIVSGSVILAALIVQTWVTLWAGDIADLYSGLDRFMLNIVLALVVMTLVVLVVGYGFSVLVPRNVVPPASRLLGALLGLANGAAIAGWLLRQAYLTSLNSTQTGPANTLNQDPFGVGFIIWAAWFPIVLALIAAIAALVAPLRRARTMVAQPSPATDWAPSTTTTTTTQSAYSAPGAAYTPGGYAPGAGAYGGYVAPPVPPVAAPPSSMAPTVSMPRTETAGPLPVRQAQDTQVQPSVPPAEPSSESSPDTSAPLSTSSNPPTGPTQRMDQDTEPPAWMFSSTRTDSEAPSSDTVKIPTTSAGTTGESEGEKRCVNCGAPLQEGAMFCTECGTRVSNQ